MKTTKIKKQLKLVAGNGEEWNDDLIAQIGPRTNDIESITYLIRKMNVPLNLLDHINGLILDIENGKYN